MQLTGRMAPAPRRSQRLNPTPPTPRRSQRRNPTPPTPRRSGRLHPEQPTPNLPHTSALGPRRRSSHLKQTARQNHCLTPKSTTTQAPIQESKSTRANALEYVFHYLDQQTLKKTRFVCKEWFALSMHLVHNMCVLNERDRNKRRRFLDFLTRFCFATELEWSGFNSWKPLSAALLYAKPPSTTRVVHLAGVALPPSPLRVPLRSLDLFGCYGGYVLSEFPVLAAFTDLTSLSMKDCNTEYSALLSIFQACPRLTRLCFDGNGLIPCDAGKVVDKSVVESSDAPLDPLSVPQLKALSITRPNLTTCHLLELLGTQSSLKMLELHDLSMSIQPQDPVHLPRLRRLTKGILAYLRRRGSSIQNLYVPYSHDVDSIDATLNWDGETFEEALAQTCPTVPVWRVMADASGYFPVCRGLARHHNVVTKLDLECVRGSTLWLRHSSDLDNFLCHPHARALLHLRLPTMHGRPESMNAFRDVDNDLSWLVEGASALKPATQRQPVWACQGLKTLTIGFSGEEKEDINRSGKYHSIHQARLIFDYVSRVCPNLEELVMTMNLIHLFLETGFIFLIRLWRLRRLEVKLDWWTEKRNVRADIDWMNADLAGALVQDVRIGERCQNRHWNNQCESIEVLYEIERRIVAGRMRSQVEQGPGSVSGDGDLQMEGEDDDRWIYLGLLADIPRVLLKLQREGKAGCHCWPKMETLRIVDNLLQDSTQAEEEIKKRRPEISCHDFKVPAPWTWKQFRP